MRQDNKQWRQKYDALATAWIGWSNNQHDSNAGAYIGGRSRALWLLSSDWRGGDIHRTRDGRGSSYHGQMSEDGYGNVCVGGGSRLLP